MTATFPDRGIRFGRIEAGDVPVFLDGAYVGSIKTFRTGAERFTIYPSLSAPGWMNRLEFSRHRFVREAKASILAAWRGEV